MIKRYRIEPYSDMALFDDNGEWIKFEDHVSDKRELEENIRLVVRSAQAELRSAQAELREARAEIRKLHLLLYQCDRMNSGVVEQSSAEALAEMVQNYLNEKMYDYKIRCENDARQKQLFKLLTRKDA